MTDPNNPYDPYGQQPNDPYGQEPNNPYGQQPNYGYQQDPHGYQQNQGNSAGGPGVGVSQPGGELPPTSPVASGPVEYRVTGPISIGFRRLNANFGSWVLFGIAYFVLGALNTWLSTPEFPDLDDPAAVQAYSEASAVGSLWTILFAIVTLVLTIFMYRGAFEEIDGRKPAVGDFFRVTRWGSLIGVFLLVILAYVVVMIPGFVLIVVGAMMSLNSAGLGGLLLILGFVALVVLIIAFVPVAATAPLAVLDGRATVTQSFGFVWAAIKPNFWKVVGTMIILALINFVGAMLCGLGLIYTMPLLVIASVAMYRQLIGGRRPLVQA